MGNEEYEKIMKMTVDFMNKTDRLNNRLVYAIVIIVVSMCLLMGIVAGIYFTADYSYPSITQEQTQSIGGNNP